MSGAVFGGPDPKIQCPKAPTCALANYKQDSMGASMGHFYRTTILRNPKKLVCTRWPLHYCDETIPGKSEPCLQTLCKELNLRTRCGEVSGLKVLGLGPISTIVIIIVTTTTIDVTTDICHGHHVHLFRPFVVSVRVTSVAAATDADSFMVNRVQANNAGRNDEDHPSPFSSSSSEPSSSLPSSSSSPA